MEKFTSFFSGLDTKSFIAVLFIIGVMSLSATSIIRDFIKAIFKIILKYADRKKS